MAIETGAPAAQTEGPPHRRARQRPEQLVERVQELTAELERVADPAARASGREPAGGGDRALRRGARADLRRGRRGGRGGRGAAASGFSRRRRRRQPDADPRPLPGRRSSSGWSRRWTAFGPYMESHGGNVELLGVAEGIARIGLRAAARAARPRPRRWSWRSSRRSTRPRPTSRASWSRAPCRTRTTLLGAGRDRAAGRPGRAGQARGRALAGSTSAGVDGARRGRADARRAERRRPGRRPGRGRPARLPRRLRRLRPGALRRLARRGRRSPARPASAASSCRGPGARSTTSGCCSSRCRCCKASAASGSRLPHERERVEAAPEGGAAGQDQGARAGRAGRRPAQARARPEHGRRTARSLGTPTPADEPGRAGRGGLRPVRQADRPPTTATCCTSIERRIICTCESCLAMRAGDRELRPTGTRIVWLDDFDLPDEIWASFWIPIGLAFFIDSTRDRRLDGALPEPRRRDRVGARARHLGAAADAEPGADGTLEADVEALIVNRMTEPHEHVIAPIDECYRLVGMIKVELGGDLRRRRPGAGDRGVLRRDAREGAGGRMSGAPTPGADRRRSADLDAEPEPCAVQPDAPDARVRGARRRARRARRRPDAGLPGQGQRPSRAGPSTRSP